METTEVSSGKTAAEISRLLIASGARRIETDFTAAGEITGLHFALLIEQVMVSFALPVRTEPVYRVLLCRRKGFVDDKTKAKIKQQAERVAWRQLLRWVQAQLALIDIGMVKSQEVFLPYLVRAGTNQSLFEYFEQVGMKQLTAADG